MTESNLYLARDGNLLFSTNLNDGDEVFTQVGLCGIHDGEPCNDVTVSIGTPLTPAQGEEVETAAEETPTLTLDFDEMSVEQLKDILRDKDMPVSGTKAELIARLNGYDEMTVEELKDELRAQGLPVSGTKEELLDRLMYGE